MSVSKLRPLPSKWLTRLGLLCLALAGLAVVCYYTYLNIRHDMQLITAKQQNVFEVFYQRARILSPAQLAQFIDESAIKTPIFSENRDALVYVYGYDFKTLDPLAQIPLMPSIRETLATYQYVLSYPEVINLYAIFDDHRLLGMMADNRDLPARLQPANRVLNKMEHWFHYFGCAAFAMTHEPCSRDEAQVSDIYTDTFTGRQTITMYFPFDYYEHATRAYRYGLTGVDIAVDAAFKDVLQPYEGLNPTRTVITFDAVEPCRPYHICLSTPLMRTKAGADLYLKWSYSYDDFVQRLLRYSPAFKLYLIALLLVMLTWRRIYARLRTLAHTDQLTRLPRRDILDQAMLQEHDYLMILDIDNFKAINDSYGHSVGDTALVAFARYLHGHIRHGDTAIRWGGEEFITLYRGLGDEAEMRQCVARLLAQPLQIAELPVPITFSAGIIRIRDYLTVPDAVTLADELLYHVKQHGKHNIAYYQGQKIRLVREPTPPAAQ
ncbi:GGDEF domain-containing protein [Aeromonas lusitana]|uniref:GGDEF domain-containing protein n=1 Tax=Aeromonas lusitana TaxID=931529 RepID=A0A2M8HB02_9GAMM|nr:GGDEF domain-containing protein [Aeromonas lusitana]PJC93756.1 GGDEF domain-containing protein [Aeromonas lusitana]